MNKCPNCGHPLGGHGMGLTGRQRELFEFIILYVAAHGGVAPSYDEMIGSTGFRSKASVHRVLKALEERGCIARLPNRARAIEVLSP